MIFYIWENSTLCFSYSSPFNISTVSILFITSNLTTMTSNTSNRIKVKSILFTHASLFSQQGAAVLFNAANVLPSSGGC